MLLRKLWRTMWLYRAQFISMVIMIALGIGVFLGFNMEWYSIQVNVDGFLEDCGYADYRITSEQGFSAEELEKIHDMDGVDAASRFLSVTADVSERRGDSVALSVTTDPRVSGMLVTDGAAYDAESTDGIWLSDRYAAANDIALGDALTLIYHGVEVHGMVRGLIKAGEYLICVRDESQLMPDYDTFGYAYVSPALYEKTMGFAFYPQINVISAMEKKEFSEAVNDALGRTTLILSKTEASAYAGSRGEIEEGQTMGSILPVLFLLIAVLTMVTTMHRLTAKEKTQIGTLKALGFRDKRIMRHYTAFALTIALIGTAFGVALGYLVAWFIMNPDGTMGTYFDMPRWKLCIPAFCYASLAAIIGLLTLIGYLSVRQILKGTAAEALRPASPKKMRPLLIERTRLFHRLSFGVRWNLRDIMRHKSRTAMSLIGIVGCTVLVVGSLGMRDTMDSFLNMYYNDAMVYSSHIYLSEDADDAAREKIIETYHGDWSATTAVELEDKAVSLDIYDLSHDKVRFPNRGSGYAEIGDDGAYVCMRLSDEFDLEPGDTFRLSPYGTDDIYTLKVAGVIRSVSENIVISPQYAQKLGLSFTPDSVYTDTEKTQVASDAAIKSVQSKQMIMDSFDAFTDIMNMMILLLVAGALILGIVVLYNLGVMSYTERYREMATLKVVGFRDRKIGRLLMEQNLWLGTVGVIVGVPCGIGVLDYLIKAMASEYEMRLAITWQTIAFSVLLTLGMSLLVSLMVSRKNKKIDMVEALKGAE